jgi:hypothetical protein
MPRLKNKNTNKNKNNIRITINNNSSSKRRRKSSGKSKQGSAVPINPMPTIIQMHHHSPQTTQTTQAQIADNNYGIGMAEKIDALAGGLTRVFETIEIKQQESYTRDKSEELFQKQLRNRENELKVLAAQRNPTVGNNAQSLQTPKDALTIDQSQSSSHISSSASGTFNGSLNSEQFGYKNDGDTFLDSFHTPKPNLTETFKTPENNRKIKPTTLLKTPDDNIDNFYGNLESDYMSEISSQSNPILKRQTRLKQWHDLTKQENLKHLLLNKIKKVKGKKDYDHERYEGSKGMKDLMNIYQNTKYKDGKPVKSKG